MNIEGVRQICLQMPHVTEDVKWENHLCFSVGGKMFCILGLDEVPVTASFKCEEADFGDLSQSEGFKPAPYLARYKWVWLKDINLMTGKEWEQYLLKAYNEVKKKLSKKILTQLQ